MSFWIAAFLAANIVCPPGGNPAVAGVRPDWIVKPSPEAMEAAYPPGAQGQNITGDVTLQCDIDVDGAAVNCRPTRETPPGFGFGEAAITVSAGFKFRPASLCGVPIVSHLTVPILFRPPPDEVWPSGSSAPPPSAEALALARQLVELTGINQRFFEVQFESKLYNERGQTPLSADERVALAKASLTLWDQERREVIDLAAVPLAEGLTPDELSQAIAFYRSSAGQKLFRDGAVLARTNQAIRTPIADYYEKFRFEYCKVLADCRLDPKPDVGK